MNTVTLVLVLAACAYADDKSDMKSEVGRQKRLLFFDEGGSLVKTYSNPYMNRLSENGQNLPLYGNFMNPFFNFIRHFGNSLIAYTIPVSNAIIESIKLDPSIQNTLVVIPKKDPVVAPNPLCEGKRTQIPAQNLCSNFLNCWDGWAFEQECPNGLMFSSYGYCDYADNVDCRNRKLVAEKPQPQQPVCNKDFEAFRNQHNCNEFFVCVNRQPVRFKCPADLAYSQILGVCDYADKVDCQSTGMPAPAAPQPPLSEPVIPPSPPVSTDSPVIPESPAPGSSMIPSVLPSLPVSPPLSPVIPPAPAAIPPLASLLPPGSFFPSAPTLTYPSQRPVSPAGVFPAPVPDEPKPDENKPPYPNIFVKPACSCAKIAKSRQDAISLLQQSMSSEISY